MKINKWQYLLSILTFVVLIVAVVLNTPNSNINFSLYVPYAKQILNGFFWTIFISLAVFALSFIGGFIMFFGSRSKIPYIRYVTNHLTTFMFGSPMLVVIIVFYFFVGTAVKIDNKLLIGIFSLTLYFSPFMMKLYISAYESIDKNQIIVCDLFGFSKFQMYRYVLFPQMLRIMLPPLSGNLSNIIKSSSLLYLIGFKELYYTITTVQAQTFAYTEGFLLLLFLYLIITTPLVKLTSLSEREHKYEN